MDFESLKNQVSNLTLYDVKAGVRKVQNAVMNLTEMEAKVREATNGDPWGASATLMQEIARGTHNYQQLNEIMPIIYKRFTDKTAEEWRQIYKALQLLEFLVKNGSERVVDDARSHLSLLRMLRQFHYIDPNGKDQGINVRNRSAELTKLLGDVDAIRSERKKARSNKNKYGGVEGGAGGGFSSGSGGRYGGFGSETGGFGGYQGEVYGDGGGFGGRETDFSGTQRRADQFEEYDEEEEGASGRPSASRATISSSATRKPAPKPKEPEPDLFEFGDDEPATSSGKAPATTSGGLADLSSPAATGDDDDFDDFQSATSPAVSAPPGVGQLGGILAPPTASTTTAATQFAAPKPMVASQATNISSILSTPSPAPPSSATPSVASLASPSSQSQVSQPYKPSGPNYFASVNASLNSTQSTPSAFAARPTASTANQSSFSSSKTTKTTMADLGKSTAKPGGAAPGSGDAFASLWSNAGSKAGVQKTATSKGPDLASMAKAKTDAGIWGAPAASTTLQQRPGATNPTPNTAAQNSKPLGNGLDDLLG
ncbi:ENTH domain-containing protein [Cyphellophora attinorum]|uniref:ENTH domain-containing protein n=1 Tax=Cyphellophora attinorum TaxID=1664694 RepID=A0A0N1H5M0_9EURO|nr:ENTH domain-containing protein [Phialophora attinorum]KPI41055.1 ENTH domain-containing protein [Phialophora attinorum]